MLDTWKDKDTRSIPHSTNGTFCTCLQYRKLIHNCMSLTVRHSLWRERIKQKSYVETTLARPTVCWLTLLDFVGINKFLPLPFTFTVNLAEIWWMRYTYIHVYRYTYIHVMLLSIWVSKNQHKGVNVLTLQYVLYHDTMWYLQSMYHLGTVHILCHRVCHLPSCYNLKEQRCTGHEKEQQEETDIQMGIQ